MVVKTKFAPGSRLPDDEAKLIETELARIADARGLLTPGGVVEAAKAVASPLHPYFEWNDEAAASEYRLGQARHLIRSVQVRVIDANKEEAWLPKYHNVRVQRQDNPAIVDRVYAPIALVRREEPLLAQVRQKIMEDLLAARRRFEVYKHIPEFNQQFERIFQEVDVLQAAD